MDIIQLYLTNDSFENINNRIKTLSENVDKTIVKEPFYLFCYVDELPKSHKHLGGRAHLINNLFVIKDDSHNMLAFFTNLFAKLCKISCPNMILSPLKYYKEGKILIQIIEYIPNWKNYSHEHSRNINFTKQLAKILAFDLIVGNTDRFLFITRYIDNIINSEQMNLWDEPCVNEGNFGFVNNNLWSMDHCANINYINKLHKLIGNKLIHDCSNLMKTYFNLNNIDSHMFEHKLYKYIEKYKKIYPLLEKLFSKN